MKKLYKQPQTENVSLQQRVSVMVGASVQGELHNQHCDAPTRRAGILYI